MKLSKKILSLLLAASMALSAGVLAAADGETFGIEGGTNAGVPGTNPANPEPGDQLYCAETENHYHTGQNSTVTRAATCSVFGVKTLEECEACHKKIVPVLVPINEDNHTAETKVLEEIDSTCTATGHRECFFCADCGRYYTKDKNGKPQYVEVEDGEDLANAKGVLIEKKEHVYDTENPVKMEKKYDCAFEVTYKCKNCNDEKVVRISQDPAGVLKPHTVAVDEAVAPGCERTGLTEGSHCSVCGETLVAQKTIPATGHKYGDWTALDITDNGEVTHKGICMNDCSSFTVEDCYDSDPVYTEATCEVGAFWTNTCEKCGRVWDTWDEEHPAFGHTWVELTDLKILPTCTDQGSDYFKCEICKKEKTVVTHETHHYPEEPAETNVAPTCTDFGYEKMFICTVCGYKGYIGVIPALGHIIENHEAQAPDCENVGWEEYESCTREGCTYSTYAEIPALGHDEIDLIGYPAEYHKEGLTDGKHCNRCGIDTVPQEVIPCVTEKLDITYTLKGLNGDEKTASSGTAVLEIRASSEHACLFGLQLELGIGAGLKVRSYDDRHLPGFANFKYTEVEDANTAGITKLVLDAAPDKNVEFSGEDVLLAKIVFDVDDTFTGVTGISVIKGIPSRQDDLNNEIDVDFGNGANIQVVLLGDSNNDGVTDINDIKNFNNWDLARGEDAAAYDSVFDFNDDGIIDGLDFILMRQSIAAA